MKRIMRICVNHPYWIVGFVVAVTLFFGAQIPDIRIDPRVEIVLRQNNPVEKEYVANKEKFASYADILVGMMHDDIYNPASLGKIRAIMGEAEGIRGVKKVTSILNVKNIRGMDGGLEVKPMVEEGTVPQTTEELENLRALASSWDVYKGAYITGDGKGTALAIVLNDDIETDDIVPIYYRLEEILQKYQGPEQFFISGPTVVEALQGHYMIRDLRLLVPLVLVVLLVSLFVFFRSIQGMLLPLVGVAISCIWTMGLMAMLGIPLTMVTTALPVALMAVSSAYGIHVLENVFSDASDGSCGRDGIIRALDRVRPRSSWQASPRWPLSYRCA
ncbi:MAG TPA: MMPL family transporter, partial [Deltaproteobacteria bacterium]|nr:MMPL family transporter [Deltaproteobacteria bacterium]